MTSKKRKLTPKQAAFIKEYPVDLNATQAAIRAGYSPRTARTIAADLLAKPNMKAEIAKVLEARSNKTEINAEWVLKRAALLANFNINKFIRVRDDGVAVYDFSTATDDDWYCISEYSADLVMMGRGDEQVEVNKVRLKSVDKMRALELVGRHVDVKAFVDTDDDDHEDLTPIPIGVKDAS